MKRRHAALTSLAIAVAPAALAACPVCFQVDESPVTTGVRAAIVVLLGVTVGVLSGFVWFARRLARRDRSS